MESVLIFILISLIILMLGIGIPLLIKKYPIYEETEPKPEQEQQAKYPYHFKYLLTKNEWDFYKKIKVVADKYNLHIIAKVRLADLVEVDDYLTGNAFNKYFWKIQAKHVDFVLCNPSNLAVIAILELEDGSHNTAERAERDSFVNKVLTKCGYKVIHTYNGANIEDTLRHYGII